MAERQNRVSEDVVEYCLFPLISSSGKDSDNSDDLQQCKNSYLTHLSPTLIDVIWQNEGFKLKAVPEKGSVPGHLLGETNFGENIQDEWFIVYLLFQLTKHFTGLVAKICDSDEEFLLIEAADVLPKWLNPESAENRVYIYNGDIHIIPIPQTPADIAIFPHSISSLGDALEFIRTYPDKTRASQKVQTAVKNRIKNYPDMMTEHTHYAHCYIPASIAAVLDEKPQLIAAAVKAFYYRDPIDLQCCRTFKYFRPGTRIMHRTRFTRCLYAQLVHQNFQPDKRSGWVVPSTSSPKYRSHDLGMKLAHGFEILCHKSDSDDNQGNQSNEVPVNGIRWQQYMQSLKDKNYFRGELEGSVLYQQLVVNAKKFYQESFRQTDRDEDVGAEILQLLKVLDVDIEGRRRAEPNLEPPDDDSWMNLTPESLDDNMQERSGNLGDLDDNDVFDLSKVADSMKTFVGNISSVDGAEFPGTGGDEDDEDADIQFDGSGFITAMQEMFEFEDSESDDSSDMDEYGWEEDASPPRHAKIKRPPSLDKYMDIMDRELAKTDVGKSFEKQKKSPKKPSKDDKPKVQTPSKDINEEDDDFEPVDIDFNTVKNLLESYGAQEGLAGPASNILGSMGVHIPPDLDKVENGENSDSFTDRKKSSKVSFEEKPRNDSREKQSVNIEQKVSRNNGDRPIPKERPKPAPRRQDSAPKRPEAAPKRPEAAPKRPDGPPRRPDAPPKRSDSREGKSTPPRPPPPRPVRPRARLDSKETDV